MNIIQTLESLSNSFGAPGFEHEIREKIKSYIIPLVDRWEVDPLGNLLAFRKGKEDFTLMLDAHMDEVGFMISYIEESGFIRFTPLGGWDIRILPSHSMTFLTREGNKVQGVIGAVPPHITSLKAREKVLSLEELFVDIGATSKEEVKQMGIRVGDPGVIDYPFLQMNSHTLRGKAFDNRVGCALAIQMLSELKEEELPCNIAVSFSVCEEVGLRGAMTATYQIQPDMALILEGTVGADVPGVQPRKRPTTLGLGPALTLADRRIIIPLEMISTLENLAIQEEIPFQVKTPASGGTDAGAIHLSRKGVPCGIISVPCRYIHSPFSMARKSDIENALKLALVFVRKGVKTMKSFGKKSQETSEVGS